MRQSASVCHKLLEDVAQQASQHISDKYIVANCLARHLLSTKQQISNELVKQAGVKSEQCVRAHSIVFDGMAEGLGRERYGTRDVRVQYRDRGGKGPGTRRKTISVGHVRGRTIDSEGMSYSKGLASTGKSFSRSHYSPKAEKYKKLLVIYDEGVYVEPKPSKQYLAQVQQMRDNWLNSKQIQQQQTAKQKQAESCIVSRIKKQQSRFQRQLQAGNNTHTYHTNGKYIIFPVKNMSKAIDTQYPIVVSSSTPIPVPTKHRKSLTTQHRPQELTRTEQQQQPHQCTKLQQFFSSKKQQLFNNNNLRQISNLSLVKQTDRVHYNQKLVNSVMNTIEHDASGDSKPKSTFRKYMSQNGNRPNSEDKQQKQHQPQQNSRIFDVQEHQLDAANIKHRKYPKNRPRTSGYHGRIKDINEPLRRTLISTK